MTKTTVKLEENTYIIVLVFSIIHTKHFREKTVMAFVNF